MIPEMLVGQRCRLTVAGEDFPYTVVAIWLDKNEYDEGQTLRCAVIDKDGNGFDTKFTSLTFDKLQSPFRLYDPER